MALGDPDVSNLSDAWLVGYQDISSFSHACKRWTGMIPAKKRDQLLSTGR
jgi:AraC-like DNA-binding protein